MEKRDWRIEKDHALVVLEGAAPPRRVRLPCPDLPEVVLQSINAVIVHVCVLTYKQAPLWGPHRRLCANATPAALNRLS